MRTLTLTTLQEKETIGLEERNATCSFCGESGKKCIKGSLPLEVEYSSIKTDTIKVPKGEMKYEKIIKDYNYGGFFNRRKYIVGELEYKYVADDYSYERIIKEDKIKTEADDADICIDCIKQLYDLTKNHNE